MSQVCRPGRLVWRLLSRSGRHSGRYYTTSDRGDDPTTAGREEAREVDPRRRESRQGKGGGGERAADPSTGPPPRQLQGDREGSAAASLPESVSERPLGEYSFDELMARIAESQKRDRDDVPAAWTDSRKKRSRTRRTSGMNIDELVEFLRQENARDICVMKVPPEREYVEYFVVCGGLGTRHIRTMADNLAAEVRENVQFV